VKRAATSSAHLGYFKLNDAADALTRALDAARAEQLSLTATLERLLEIEVNATEARKQDLSTLMTVASRLCRHHGSLITIASWIR
jgi:hypothetical protein